MTPYAHVSCKGRQEFDKEDIEILGSITPSVRNGINRAHCNFHATVKWPYIFCEEIREAKLCPEGFK